MPLVSADVEPLALVFEDDGLVPNNPMPFLVYKGAIDARPRPSRTNHRRPVRRQRLGRHVAQWRLRLSCITMRPCTRRSASREATRGCASAATAARNWKSQPATSPSCPPARDINACPPAPDFSVVGAYPPGAKMQITRPTPENHAKALQTIPQVKLPEADPVMGPDGPLVRLWRQKS